ncbi:MAG: agmatine deiminase family protein [Gemmatimonadaceae bacterium]|nr:agmatine deiminase family protein [Gemmatimonadaceae bacterium]
MPAEWEAHAATWIGWPHHQPDWPGKFEPIPWVYAEIVRSLSRHEHVEVLCDDESVLDEARDALVAHGVNLSRVGLHVVGTDRVWLRDSAPTAVMAPNGTVHWVSWKFNGWAKYDNFARDELIGMEVSELSELAREEAVRPDGEGRLVLEGGGIETNGAGALLVTEEWLLSDTQIRNPGLGRADYERAFAHYLGATRTIWLGEGCVGDDTHGHVDDIARFTDERTIVLAVEDDPADENHERSIDNVQRLELAAKTFPGGLRIVRLPFPRPVTMHGERLPASYANFYIANGVVLVPTFNDRNDRTALNTISELFPAREVVGIHAVDLVWGLGTLHCLTQQQPAGR